MKKSKEHNLSELEGKKIKKIQSVSVDNLDGTQTEFFPILFSDGTEVVLRVVTPQDESAICVSQDEYLEELEEKREDSLYVSSSTSEDEELERDESEDDNDPLLDEDDRLGFSDYDDDE